ncbi:MAG: cytochrome b, partial [Betaproteobacteria bacterium HGW-Betaproteobacteria-21]
MNTTYTRTAVSLHWLMALGLIGAFSLGVYMHELPLSPFKLK